MNDNMYDEEKTNNTSDLKRKTDVLYDAYSKSKAHQSDVDRIKNRKGVNEATPRRNEEETVDSKNNNNSGSSLGEKDKLDKKDRIDDKKTDNNGSRGLNVKNVAENATGITGLKNRFFRLRLELKIAFTVLPILFLGIIGLALISAGLKYVHVFTGAISNFFGVPEGNIVQDGKTRSGIYTEEEYLFDENGNLRSSESLVNMLKTDGDQCKVTFWNKIWDKITPGIDDRCEFMRYIKKAAEKRGTDASLIISTIIYGYSTQPAKSQYYDNEDIPKDYISTVNHYLMLENILNSDDSPITKRMLDRIIDNTIVEKTRWFYTWEITETTNRDGEVTGKTGVCKYTEIKTEEYSLDKWKVFMRFGAQAASAFEEANNKTFAFESSDEECNGSMSEGELLERVRSSGFISGPPSSKGVVYSVNVADALNTLEGVTSTYSDAFYQKADINSKTIDVFKSFNGIEFDYGNGFAYQSFPGFGKAMTENPAITNIVFDSINTPKQIESLIQNIINQKISMNEVLRIPDVDNPDSFKDADRSSSVVTGAYCSNYLSSPLSNIKVRLTDCHGNEIGTTTFEDYIIGVANAEVSNSGDNYVLSEMLAAISYALRRHNNYLKGDTITMKSGTCDQAYCSMNKGCSVQSNPDVCKGCSSFYIGGNRGKNPGLYAKYKSLYETASQFLVVSDGKVHNAHYVSTIQNQWKAKADQGMSFTQIIQETYQDEGAEVIKCSDQNAVKKDDDQIVDTTRVGNKATSDYPKVSDDLGKFYGFSYKDNESSKEISINPKWKNANLVSMKPSCSNNSFASMTFTVHKDAKANYEKAFKGICDLLTTGVRISNGETCKYTMADLQGGTVFMESKTEFGDFDLHPYGLAQSWNYLSSYTINGVKYSPYSPTTTKEEYLSFIDAIGGKEESCKNINYILWLKAYKDAGFEWGGNFGRNGNNGSYRGNEYQIVYK